MLPRGSQYNLRHLGHMLPVLDLCYLDPAQPLATTGEELDDLDHYLHLSEVCQRVRGLKPLWTAGGTRDENKPPL